MKRTIQFVNAETGEVIQEAHSSEMGAEDGTGADGE